MNGRDETFEKNGEKRCRVVCKDKKHCSYIVFCSIVLTSTTFRIKTLFRRHKYGRQFFNKSVEADSVVKVIIDGMKNNNKMKLDDIIGNVMLSYVTEIFGCRDFKASRLARQIVEGDSSKQYGFYSHMLMN